MIIWIASYPKSGNTWLRAFITSLLYKDKNLNSLDKLKQIHAYPLSKDFYNLLDDFENFETQVWKPVAEKNILAGNLRQWILVEAIGRSENAYSGWTHLVFNVQAENPGDPVMMSGFKWDKLWEGIESSRDMSEADELVCVYSMN